ncbi:uncharacterized protein LOC130555530 [Triplophysa rosa]|uniref:uncharacterized protein LOC130555530 n=1 Tax=Triplophysa rosa TaxID=992332 RepID=UPI0025461B98|nr:uncharacterized protein LOC130555530 [Triplophysa rosa]
MSKGRKYKSFLEDDRVIPNKKHCRRNKYKIFLEDEEEETPRNTSVRRNTRESASLLSETHTEEEQEGTDSESEDTQLLYREDPDDTAGVDVDGTQWLSNENSGSVDPEDGNTTGATFIHDGDQPLYPGAKLSKGESLTALLSYMLRHHVTKAGCQDLLHLLQMLLPENSLPSTNYLFNRAFDKTSWQLHHYCLNPDCGAYIGYL